MRRRGSKATIFMALTGIAILGGGGLIYWQYSSFSEASSAVAKLENDVNDTAGLERELINSRRKLQEGTANLIHLESGVSSKEFVPTLLQNLEATGRQCNLQIIGVRPLADKSAGKKTEAKGADSPKKKPYLELDIEVKAAGMFDQMMNFLKKLEDFPKIVAVRAVSVSPKIAADGYTISRLETTVTLRVFLFVQEQSPTVAMNSAQGGA